MDSFRNEEGLTLVETIIALVLMLVLIAAFAGAMTVALQREVEVDKRLEASRLASSTIEFLRSNSRLDNYTSQDEFIGYNEEISFSDLGAFYDNFIEYDGFANSFIIIDEFGSPDLYELKVVIKWTDRGNEWENKIVTLVAVD